MFGTNRNEILSVTIALFGLIIFGVSPVKAGSLSTPGVSWTGFSIEVGGGFASLNSNVHSSASRTDSVTICDLRDCGSVNLEVADLTQTYSSKHNDISDQGGFFTVGGGYDYQFAPRWVAGAFVDADWSNLNAHAKETNTTALTLFPNGTEPLFENDGTFPLNLSLGNTTINTKVSTDWSVSVGGRIGWLATENTLLYFLAAYTHADLDTARVNVAISDPLGAIDNLGLLPVSINSPTNLSVRLPTSLDGFSLGGGSEVKLGGPWTAKLEYRWTHLDGGTRRDSSSDSQFLNLNSLFGDGSDVGITRNIESNASASFDADIQSVRAEISYHFWTGTGAL
jgi:opacity protein-like surface antigen